MLLFFYTVLAGISGVLTPGFLPVLFVVLGLGGGQAKSHPSSVVMGFLISFGLMGPVILLQRVFLGIPLTVWHVVSGAVLIALGAWVVLRSWRRRGNPQEAGPDAWPIGFFGGLALGSVFIPCVGSVMGTVVLLAQTGAFATSVGFLFAAYALGIGIPALFITHLITDLFHRFWKTHPQSHLFPIVLGSLVIAVGWVYLLGFDEVLMRAFVPLSPFIFFAL